MSRWVGGDMAPLLLYCKIEMTSIPSVSLHLIMRFDHDVEMSLFGGVDRKTRNYAKQSVQVR